MMSAAVPATALVHPVDSIGVMPRGLTDTDGERIAAAIEAARTESTAASTPGLVSVGAVVHRTGSRGPAW